MAAHVLGLDPGSEGGHDNKGIPNNLDTLQIGPAFEFSNRFNRPWQSPDFHMRAARQRPIPMVVRAG